MIATTPELRLREHEVRRGVCLTPAQREGLLALDAGLELRPEMEPGRYEIRAASTVGVFEFEGLRVSIAPKLGIRRVLHLLMRSGAGWADHLRPTEFGAVDDLPELLARAFAGLLAEGLRRGLPEGYQTRQAALPSVRGRILFDDQIRRQRGLVLPVEVRFAELTEDIELNRLLKAAARLLLACVRPDSATGRALQRLNARMARVRNEVYHPLRVPMPALDRRADHLAPALQLAHLVLTHRATEFGGHGARATGLLFDMDRVFERFLFRELGRHLGLGGRAWVLGAQGRAIHLDHGRRLRLSPDLTWWEGDTCVFVGDAKYKSVQADGPPRADLYQMLGYLVGTGLQQGLLVYGSLKAGGLQYRIVEGDRAIHVESIDLGGDVRDLDRELARLAGVVRGMVGAGI